MLTMIYIMIYIKIEIGGRNIMTMRAKLFENGRSQAVRLPKEYRFEGDEVRINRIGDIVILVPVKSKWDNFMKAVDMFSDDFLAEERAEQTGDKRETL